MTTASILRLHSAHLQRMQDHAVSEAPNEACGLVAGFEGESRFVYPITNELDSPTLFRMKASEQVQAFDAMEKAGWDLLAIYHSHPAGPQRPSLIDIADAYYPGVAHFILSPLDNQWICKCFSLDGGQSVDLEYELLAA